MESLEDTIQLLKKVILDENCKRMNKSVIIGYLGELAVLQKLKNEGFNPQHLGKQSGYDILVNSVKIEVKTSELKDDGFGINNWGWTLLRKNQNIKYDVVICVALDYNFNIESYYCIYKENIAFFFSTHGRFTSITNRFQKFPQAPTESSSKKFQDAYKGTEQLFNDRKVFEIRPDEYLEKFFRNGDS